VDKQFGETYGQKVTIHWYYCKEQSTESMISVQWEQHHVQSTESMISVQWEQHHVLTVFYFFCLCLSLRLFQFHGFVTFYFDIVWWTKLDIYQLMNARETPAYRMILYVVLCVVC